MSDLVRWTPNLTVHVDIIDSQHQELFKRLNDLLNAVLQGRGRDEVGGFIKFVVDYTDFHLGLEERYMAHHNYPGMNGHKAMHDRFRADAARAAQDAVREGVSSETVANVIEGLGAWLQDHIRRMDVELGKYLKERM